MNVSINGKEVLTWSGDQVAIENIEKAVREAAAHERRTPDAMTESAVALFPTMGLVKKGPQRSWQRMQIVYFILSTDTGRADLPGKYRDYVPRWDFNIDIRVSPDGGRWRFDINAKGSLWHASDLPPEGSA